jgi:Fe-S cluster biogenesis protein NfuA
MCDPAAAAMLYQSCSAELRGRIKEIWSGETALWGAAAEPAVGLRRRLGRAISRAVDEEQRMFIQTEATPNPATMKFLPGRVVVEGAAVDFASAEAASGVSPLAERLFAVGGVGGVHLGGDFISVTKSEAEDWYTLKPAVLGAIMEHFLSGEPVLVAGAALPEPVIDESDPVVSKIRELIDSRVRPAVARDGGDIVLQGFERGVVYLHLRGACSGCPSSVITLKNGIENLLKYYVPEVVEVRAVG